MVADAFHAVDCPQNVRLTIDCVIVPQNTQNIDTSALMSAAVSLVETACDSIVSRDKLVGGSVRLRKYVGKFFIRIANLLTKTAKMVDCRLTISRHIYRKKY